MDCSNCGRTNIEQARFCTECGHSLKGLKGRLQGLTKKIVHQTNKTVEEYKHRADEKISELLERLDQETTYVGSYQIPEKRKPSVRKALLRFQEKIGTSSPQEEMSYEDWMANLPSILEAQKCVVCFSTFDKSDEILVCPHCETGGHNEHILSWVSTSRACPFCRETISISNLVQLG